MQLGVAHSQDTLQHQACQHHCDEVRPVGSYCRKHHPKPVLAEMQVDGDNDGGELRERSRDLGCGLSDSDDEDQDRNRKYDDSIPDFGVVDAAYPDTDDGW